MLLPNFIEKKKKNSNPRLIFIGWLGNMYGSTKAVDYELGPMEEVYFEKPYSSETNSKKFPFSILAGLSAVAVTAGSLLVLNNGTQFFKSSTVNFQQDSNALTMDGIKASGVDEIFVSLLLSELLIRFNIIYLTFRPRWYFSPSTTKTCISNFWKNMASTEKGQHQPLRF